MVAFSGTSDPNVYQTSDGRLWWHASTSDGTSATGNVVYLVSTSSYEAYQQIDVSSLEEEKEDPPEINEGPVYPTRHADEKKRIIMRQEVWRPPRRQKRPRSLTRPFLFLMAHFDAKNWSNDIKKP